MNSWVNKVFIMKSDLAPPPRGRGWGEAHIRAIWDYFQCPLVNSYSIEVFQPAKLRCKMPSFHTALP
jgi:hypothetical protein